MIEAFTAYIKTIAAFTLFAAFAEMLMPDNSFKKYIQLIMGIMLLSVMLKPMFSVLNIASLDFGHWEQTQDNRGEAILENQTYYTELENRRMIEAYGFNLNKTLTEDIQNHFGEELTVTVTLNKNSNAEEFGKIQAVLVEGHCQQGEELVAYLKNTYHITPDVVKLAEYE